MPDVTTLQPKVLSGRRILVVEDDFYLADDAGRALRAAGAEIVGPIPRSAAALDAIARDGIDAAVVDINLGDGPSFDLADALKRHGVPFVFVTGYDEVLIPERHAGAITVQKPADARAVVQALAALLC
jgi:DNA-binding response OmpR family regulator